MFGDHRLLICFLSLSVMPIATTNAAVYRVSGSVTESFAGFGSTLDSFDNSGSEISTPFGTAQYVGNDDTPRVNGLGTASANAFGLRAGATALMVKDFEFGSTSRYNFGVGAFASGIWSDFIVTGPASPVSIPISVNLNIEGSTLALATTSPSGQSQAISSVQFNIRGNNQLFGGSYSRTATNGIVSSPVGTGLLSGFDGNTDITSPSFSVPVNTPFTIELQLSVSSNLSANFSEIFTLNANTNFLNTVTFAPNGPVFNLPAGYTINSVDAGIVDNLYVIPEASSLVFTSLGFVMFASVAARMRAANYHQAS